MKKILGALMASALLLGACDTEREPPNPGGYGEEENENSEAANTDEVETNDETDEESSELDDDTLAELDQDIEEINWHNVHLTRSQFDSLLYEMQDDLSLDSEENDEMDIYIDSIDFSNEQIDITVINTDNSEFSEFTTGFFAVFIDSLYRQLYLNSDYSDGSTHPHIIIQDNNGEVITDQVDFIEFEE